MLKPGKICAAGAMGLLLGLSLLTSSAFAQSMNHHGRAIHHVKFQQSSPQQGTFRHIRKDDGNGFGNGDDSGGDDGNGFNGGDDDNGWNGFNGGDDDNGGGDGF